jgi:hypothetical protein
MVKLNAVVSPLAFSIRTYPCKKIRDIFNNLCVGRTGRAFKKSSNGS